MTDTHYSLLGNSGTMNMESSEKAVFCFCL